MKITVDIDDIWVDEGSITQELKRQIITDAVAQIRSEITEACRSAIKDEIKVRAEDMINQIVSEQIQEALDTEYIKNEYKNYDGPTKGKELITLREYSRNLFHHHASWQSAKQEFEKMGKNFATECKKRYDMAFASSIVSALKDNGLLRDERLMQLLDVGDSKE